MYGYLLATLSHLNPSGSWGWRWKSPGQHRRTTPSHTLLPNSISASAATLQTQQGFGFHTGLLFVFHLWDISQEDYRDSNHLSFSSALFGVQIRTIVAKCLLKKAPDCPQFRLEELKFDFRNVIFDQRICEHVGDVDIITIFKSRKEHQRLPSERKTLGLFLIDLWINTVFSTQLQDWLWNSHCLLHRQYWSHP